MVVINSFKTVINGSMAVINRPDDGDKAIQRGDNNQ